MERLKRGCVVLGFLGLGATALHCGGEAVIDPPLGSGGATSSSNGNTSSNMSSSTLMTAPATTTGPQTDCEIACSTIYDCGVENDRCPGFDGTPSDRDAFLQGPSGNDGCVSVCETNPLLMSLIDPNDCDSTINNIKSASTDFLDSCDNGI